MRRKKVRKPGQSKTGRVPRFPLFFPNKLKRAMHDAISQKYPGQNLALRNQARLEILRGLGNQEGMEKQEGDKK